MKIRKLLILVWVVILVTSVQAQLPIDGVHYPVGLEGLKGGSLPVPGMYFRDDNLFYTGTSDLPLNFKTSVYLQAPHLTWMTDWKVLGANYGLGVMVPFVYKETSYINRAILPNGRTNDFSIGENRFGLGDIEIEPLLLSWHLKQFDFMATYALWLPTGHYEESGMVNLGNDRWAHMVTLGGVWYPDEAKTWAFSVLNRLELNSQKLGTRTDSLPNGRTTVSSESVSCSTYVLEWGISKTIFKKSDIGIIGYYQEQFIGRDQNDTVFFSLPSGGQIISTRQSNGSRVAGIGPEVRTQISRWGLSASLRYAYEFLADNRPQGHTIALTLTKIF